MAIHHFCYQTPIPSLVAFMTIITELPDIILVGKTRSLPRPGYLAQMVGQLKVGKERS
jgi:hypothetical protein